MLLILNSKWREGRKMASSTTTTADDDDDDDDDDYDDYYQQQIAFMRHFPRHPKGL